MNIIQFNNNFSLLTKNAQFLVCASSSKEAIKACGLIKLNFQKLIEL